SVLHQYRDGCFELRIATGSAVLRRFHHPHIRLEHQAFEITPLRVARHVVRDTDGQTTVDPCLRAAEPGSSHRLTDELADAERLVERWDLESVRIVSRV